MTLTGGAHCAPSGFSGGVASGAALHSREVDAAPVPQRGQPPLKDRGGRAMRLPYHRELRLWYALEYARDEVCPAQWLELVESRVKQQSRGVRGQRWRRGKWGLARVREILDRSSGACSTAHPLG